VSLRDEAEFAVTLAQFGHLRTQISPMRFARYLANFVPTEALKYAYEDVAVGWQGESPIAVRSGITIS
jgi:hypothetical protein